MATLTERIRSFFGLSEAPPPDGQQIDPDDYMYRRVTDTKRDLFSITHTRAREISRALWRQNPMAKRLVEIQLDMVLGDGLTLKAVDEEVQKIIDEFWEDPQMRFDLRFRDLMRDMMIEGELVLRAFHQENGGRCRLGYIDPDRIKEVRKDPDNAFVDESVVLNPKQPGGEDEVLEVISVEIYGDSYTYSGDTFFYAINRLVAGTRGNPDLLALADWIDGHDQILFNALDRTGLQNAFVWDVLLQGADETTVTDWAQKHSAPPRPGSVRVHNESEAWQAVTPSLGAAELETVARMVKNLVLGGAGLPEAWFAEGDSANRATLAEQGTPTFRMIVARQKMVKAIVEDILAYVIQLAIEAGRLGKGVDRTVTVDLPEPSADDLSEMVTSLPQLATAMTGAIAEKLISRESARDVFLQMVGQLGVELNAEDEAKTIEEEAAVAEQEAQKAIEQAQQMMAATGTPGLSANGKQPQPQVMPKEQPKAVA